MKSISIIRILVLGVMFSAAMLLLGGEESDEGTLAFLLHCAIDKGAGLALVVTAFGLYLRWSRTDSLFRRISRLLFD